MKPSTIPTARVVRVFIDRLLVISRGDHKRKRDDSVVESATSLGQSNKMHRRHLDALAESRSLRLRVMTWVRFS